MYLLWFLIHYLHWHGHYYHVADKETKGSGTKTLKTSLPRFTPELTTLEPTTPEPTTLEPTTLEPTTPEPTTLEPTTPEPTTLEPTTLEPTTQEPTTLEPTTQEPTTPEPTTQEPTTLEPTTLEPTTPEPTTQEPTTPEPTTLEPTTQEPTTLEPTTQEPTTPEPTTTLTPSEKSCPQGWQLYANENKCIKVFDDVQKQWESGREYCQSQGGDYVKIKDQDTLNFVKGLVGTNRYWIGLMDMKSDGKFEWVNEDTETTFTAWRRPPKGVNNCVELIANKDSQWNARSCKAKRSLICELYLVKR